MNRIWIDVKPDEPSDSSEAKVKFSKVEELLTPYNHYRESLSRGFRWKVSDEGLKDVTAHARGIRSNLSRFLRENEFLVSLGDNATA
ncbi:MAG TPA: hypothetical protein VNO50_03130 [Pyrinomonadaceae bacterium]|nr:hypothetical protein [Pyrinomonadaceae bacterium]